MKNKYLWKAFGYVWRQGKWWLILSVTLSVLIGCSPFLTLWVAKEIINEVTRFIQGETKEYLLLFWLLIGQFMLTLILSAITNIRQYFDKRMECKLDYDVQQLILEKTTEVSIMQFDLPDFHNHLQRISGGGARFLSPIRSVIDIVQSAFSLFSYAVFLFVIDWRLVIVSLVAAIPFYYMQAKLGKRRFALHVAQSLVAREAEYYKFLLQDRGSVKEIRLFGLAPFLRTRWAERFWKNAKEQLNLEGKQQKNEVGMEGFSALFYLGMAVILIWLARTTKMGIGEFIAIIQAVQGTQGTFTRISMLLAKLYEEKLFIKDFYQFFEREDIQLPNKERVLEFPSPIQNGITFENVSFRYTGGEHDVLKNVSFHVYPQEKIAIVGQNGSGKTTLMKCLMGLYPLTNGEIKVDGMSIWDIDETQLHNNLTVIFQDFIRYDLSVKENIAIGNVAKIADRDKVQYAARLSGVDSFVERFPQSYETHLGKVFGEGEDLSGGQWQKIALARALFRDSQVIILDEPTAALDPIAEMDIFNKFKLLSENKIAIFTSHRMAASRMADRIIVMKEGRIVEMGTYEQLMALEQEYFHMYQMQAQWFSSEKVEMEVMGWRN
ncbi:ABC transporter ATP-binding protein [uncultured Brevibacillus sp.]|uniref:ABC transporter ATP-binding protein n=1 Tax=uncultured Brevibacillus sp. TaxID=169970 RepID=UPI002596C18C|nr:ABC transporter ATP-binding protein [uncultured Brevibacillus sp.]